MTRLAVLLALTAALLGAQSAASQSEQGSLQQALGEAGNSPIEFIRAVEQHLQRFPQSPRRAELERAAVKTAIDLKDDRRIIEFGENVLARESDNLQVLEPVTTALLRQADQASAGRALEHARHFEQLIQATYKDLRFAPGGGRDMAKRKDDYDRAQARVRILEARAQGLLGHKDQAIELAEASYTIYPSIEGAREAARWLAESGKDREAMQYFADAFAIAGLHSSDLDGASDRARMAELNAKLHGADGSLGDLILKAYDDTSQLFAARRAELRVLDPNSQVKDPLLFTLSSLDGDKLALSSLIGKVMVLDFWATWCQPCRAQHALYEQVKARFKDSAEVVFLSVDTDDDHSLVKPFAESQKWTQKIYFDDGLQYLLQVSNIPTTMVYGKKGELVSRMIGYLPDRFVDMLTERIDEALGRTALRPGAQPLSQ
ncbi:MAG TPA: TlpA disulfide reductase family protein [Bryobacteraceae bacterium]|nr:TlpA disulfide reductase family protein [Bryobacteraceae bacterium]